MNESSTSPKQRRRADRAAPLGSAQDLGQKTSAESNRRAAGILEALAGVRSAPEVAAALGLSLPYYYLLERKALGGLARACEAQPKVFVATLSGMLSVREALAKLELGESYFHELRGQWLADAVALLEPQPSGRPPRAVDPGPLAEEVERLRRETQELRLQLRAAQTRVEVSGILAPPADAAQKNARSTTLWPRPK